MHCFTPPQTVRQCKCPAGLAHGVPRRRKSSTRAVAFAGALARARSRPRPASSRGAFVQRQARDPRDATATSDPIGKRFGNRQYLQRPQRRAGAKTAARLPVARHIFLCSPLAADETRLRVRPGPGRRAGKTMRPRAVRSQRKGPRRRAPNLNFNLAGVQRAARHCGPEANDGRRRSRCSCTATARLHAPGLMQNRGAGRGCNRIQRYANGDATAGVAGKSQPVGNCTVSLVSLSLGRDVTRQGNDQKKGA